MFLTSAQCHGGWPQRGLQDFKSKQQTKSAMHIAFAIQASVDTSRESTKADWCENAGNAEQENNQRPWER